MRGLWATLCAGDESEFNHTSNACANLNAPTSLGNTVDVRLAKTADLAEVDVYISGCEGLADRCNHRSSLSRTVMDDN